MNIKVYFLMRHQSCLKSFAISELSSLSNTFVPQKQNCVSMLHGSYKNQEMQSFQHCAASYGEILEKLF